MSNTFGGREREPMEIDAEFNAAPFITEALLALGTSRTKLIAAERFRSRFPEAKRGSTDRVVVGTMPAIDKR